MKITLLNISKRFNYDTIFQNINYTFISGESYAVAGPNGSGKSTLIKILSGILTPSSGKIKYEHAEKIIPVENIFRLVSYAAPYLELIEEFTLEEMLDFHFKLKTMLPGFNLQQLIEIINFQKHQKKQIKNFSSGMKQRVKLALAIFSDTEMLLLDEPTTNLDAAGVEWYLQYMEKYTAGRLTIIGSNLEREYSFCKNVVHILDYKQQT